ncbi:hypothetical protein ACLOJK_030036 [Asimina triloba]
MRKNLRTPQEKKNTASEFYLLRTPRGKHFQNSNGEKEGKKIIIFRRYLIEKRLQIKSNTKTPTRTPTRTLRKVSWSFRNAISTIRRQKIAVVEFSGHNFTAFKRSRAANTTTDRRLFDE